MHILLLSMRKTFQNSLITRILSLIITSSLIFGLCVGLYVGIEKKVYPLHFKDEIEYFCDKCELDFYQVISVIKIESDFNQNAVSVKGAKGLMQLLDTTAEYVAKMIGKKHYNVFIPRDNIELGCHYLKYLLNKFNVTNTALCAYNAGEGNVKDWLEEKSFSEDGKTLKVIPYKETREYILKFEKTFAKYKKLYGNLLDKQ